MSGAEPWIDSHDRRERPSHSRSVLRVECVHEELHMSSGGFERKPAASTLVQEAFEQRHTSVAPGKRSLTEQLSPPSQTAAAQRKATTQTSNAPESGRNNRTL